MYKRQILTQTAKALKDTSHPYRQKIDVDFGGRVEVYTKMCIRDRRVTVLDYAFLSTITEKADGTVIYADRCSISEDKLAKMGVTCLLYTSRCV